MIVVLYQDDCEAIAQAIGADLTAAFRDHVQIATLSASATTPWPGDNAWDDLLIVLYSGRSFPSEGDNFVRDFLVRKGEHALLLPVASELAPRTPPPAAAAIKALEYDHSAQGLRGRLVNRVGGMLGLRLQGRDTRIFVSYRASDGSEIARQVHAHLTSLGHRAYMDEARDLDGETLILPGSPVQSEIEQALLAASLVLLIDTPEAPGSRWIKHEVDTADGMLVPILPVCFRRLDDSRHGPRFPSLLALQRWVEFTWAGLKEDSPLDDGQLQRIVAEVEQYLCEIFRRKCRVSTIVETEFVSRGYEWTVLDKGLLMFASSKKHGPRLATKVHSHCSVFEQVYIPALSRFCSFLKGAGPRNHSLFIYDGELLPDSQLEELIGEHDEDVVILHHQELATLIDSNFRVLGTA